MSAFIIFHSTSSFVCASSVSGIPSHFLRRTSRSCRKIFGTGTPIIAMFSTIDNPSDAPNHKQVAYITAANVISAVDAITQSIRAASPTARMISTFLSNPLKAVVLDKPPVSVLSLFPKAPVMMPVININRHDSQQDPYHRRDRAKEGSDGTANGGEDFYNRLFYLNHTRSKAALRMSRAFFIASIREALSSVSSSCITYGRTAETEGHEN